jgi:hypothetical protein
MLLSYIEGLAAMYRDGIYVSKNFVRAYDLYLEERDYYYELNINTMVQGMLKKMGARIKQDGDFGPNSCNALRSIVPGGACGRIPSRADVKALATHLL